MSVLAESFVQLDESVGGWSKYYLRDRNELGVWGTASGVIGLCLGRLVDVELGPAPEQIDAMIHRGANFLMRRQITGGRNDGAWSISQLRTPAFVDTTTIAARALCMAGLPECYPAIAAAVHWLGSCQLPSGGWSNLEKDRRERQIAKTCPTAYSALTIRAALNLPIWSDEETSGLRRQLDLATGSLKSGITAAITHHVASGWGRALTDSHPDPAYTSVALTALHEAGENAFIRSYGSSIVRLYAATQNRAVGPRFDQAPWANVRDIWTPPAPLAERFMMFFTTAWLVRALGPLNIAESAPLLDAAMEWLTDSDRGGKYFDYYNLPHNFVSMDALWACKSYLQHRELTRASTVARTAREDIVVDNLGQGTVAVSAVAPQTRPPSEGSHLSSTQLAIWRQAAEQLRHAINDQISKRAGVSVQRAPSVQLALDALLAQRAVYQRLLPMLDESVALHTLAEMDRLGKDICGVAWPELPWPASESSTS